MSQSARVTSIGVLQTLATALQRFRGESTGAMDDLEIEVRRAVEWIHHDRKDYWAKELRRASDSVTQARLQLQQAQMSRRIAGHQPSCIDEQRAVERAKRRQETAIEKIEAVKHWTYTIDRAVDDFLRCRTQFLTWLDTDIPQAVAALNRMSQALESYISLEAPAAPDMPIVSSTSDETEAGEASQNIQAAKSEPESPGSPNVTRSKGGAP